MSVSSVDLSANSLAVPSTLGEFVVNIHIDYPSTKGALLSKAEDEGYSVEQTITLNVLPPATDPESATGR